MCKYCCFLDYSKDIDNGSPLVKIKVEIGGMSFGKFPIYISDEAGSGEPHLEILDSEMSKVKAIKKINYCPMCGEKLKVIR